MTVRDAILEAFHAACGRVDLAGRVANALGSEGPFIVIAAGKAATTMLAGVRNFERALVIIPRGSPMPPADPRVIVMEASHPLPDESSVRAADAALALAAGDSPLERLFLISGGTSSLLCAPAKGLTLERKRDAIDRMLRIDASIARINVVRRHLSRVKGGHLARACGPRPRRTLIVSDVITGGAQDVGSGPTVADPTTIRDAMSAAAALALDTALPWTETSKNLERMDLLAAPQTFAALMREELARRGLPDATLTMEEPTLRVPSDAGRGGRCTHAAAVASLELREGETFAAIATDGVDGSSGTGGAIVEGPLEGASESIARFDTGTLHLAAGTAIPSAPTGVNFADVHVRVAR